MLAALEPIAADASWADVGRAALLDILHGLTGGSAVGTFVDRMGLGGDQDAAAAAAARQVAEQAQQRRLIMVLAGVGGAVVIAALLLRR